MLLMTSDVNQHVLANAPTSTTMNQEICFLVLNVALVMHLFSSTKMIPVQTQLLTTQLQVKTLHQETTMDLTLQMDLDEFLSMVNSLPTIRETKELGLISFLSSHYSIPNEVSIDMKFDQLQG